MILTINAGSSSLRFSLFDGNLNQIYKAHIDAIAQKNCIYKAYYDKGKEEVFAIKVKDHKKAILFALEELNTKKLIENKNAIQMVAHRVVHGGEKFKKPAKLNLSSIRSIKKLSALAPLHNPANLAGIKAAKKALPKSTHWAVFDTSFHSTLPEHAYLYGLPYSLYKKQGIRRYGFHGSSHKYVSQRATEILKQKKLKLITCHMGNGVSIAAVKNGICKDTSMGFTPLEGPMMGTRSGSFDPAIIFHLAEKKSLESIERIVQKKSGFLGLSTLSSDVRELKKNMKSKNTTRCFSLFSYQVAKLILSYCAALNGAPDAIVFTAGIGENAYYLRESICKHLSVLNVRLSKAKNKANASVISSPASSVKVLVIPTNEELQMATEIKALS